MLHFISNSTCSIVLYLLSPKTLYKKCNFTLSTIFPELIHVTCNEIIQVKLHMKRCTTEQINIGINRHDLQIVNISVCELISNILQSMEGGMGASGFRSLYSAASSSSPAVIW